MSVVINRVYTRTGDAGTTRLAGGQEVEKTSARIAAYGTLDELNACLGIVAEEIRREPAEELEGMLGKVRRIQNELFDLGGELAVLPADRHPQQQVISETDVDRLEQEMDAANEGLPTLRSFILPGGGMLSAFLHQARTVCRRAERGLVALHADEPQRSECLRYLNRLSDWLFVMGRRAVHDRGEQEVLWRPGDRSES
ncbi:MAG: cob(I)yrinic acid a,c-diamide adenosyltransferase [Myxococcota bacterium]